MPDETVAVVTDMRPEIEVLLGCARTAMDPAGAERLRGLLGRELDWTYLTEQALGHGVMPLLYRQLNAICPQAVPAPVLAELGSHFQANARRNLFLTGELLKVVELLESHGIAVIPYKGPVLAAAVYGNLAWRQFLDLDILIQKGHTEKARELLLSQGFQPKSHTPGVKDAGEFAHAFLEKDGRFVVEMHWGVTPGFFSFDLDMERLWQCLESVPLAGKQVRHIPAEYLLLILCVHGSRHRWQRLGWITDVAELMQRNPDLDWQWIMATAAQTGSERMVCLGLHLVRDLLDVPLPAQLAIMLDNDSITKALAAQVRGWLFAPPEGLAGDVATYAFFCRVREHWLDRLRYLFHLASYRLKPNDEDQAFVSLPRSLFVLYYLLRPLRLMKAYALTLLKYPFNA